MLSTLDYLERFLLLLMDNNGRAFPIYIVRLREQCKYRACLVNERLQNYVSLHLIPNVAEY